MKKFDMLIITKEELDDNGVKKLKKEFQAKFPGKKVVLLNVPEDMRLDHHEVQDLIRKLETDERI